MSVTENDNGIVWIRPFMELCSPLAISLVKNSYLETSFQHYRVFLIPGSSCNLLSKVKGISYCDVMSSWQALEALWKTTSRCCLCFYSQKAKQKGQILLWLWAAPSLDSGLWMRRRKQVAIPPFSSFWVLSMDKMWPTASFLSPWFPPHDGLNSQTVNQNKSFLASWRRSCWVFCDSSKNNY